jgi:adenylate kinase
MNLILLGPPGAGKKTQAEMLAGALDIPKINAGELLRAVVKERTSWGQEAKAYIDQGRSVPDEVVGEIIQERLRGPDCRNGSILDGFPRTIRQAQTLDAIMANLHKAIDHVLSIEMEKGELIKRLSGWRVCRQCGRRYHVIFDPPLNINSCDQCRGELIQREDDHEEAVRKRLEVYDAETFPLSQYYKEKNLIRSINGQGGIQQIFERIKSVLT